MRAGQGRESNFLRPGTRLTRTVNSSQSLKQECQVLDGPSYVKEYRYRPLSRRLALLDHRPLLELRNEHSHCEEVRQLSQDPQELSLLAKGGKAGSRGHNQ